MEIVNNMTVFSISEFRKAQKFVKDLDKALKVINAAEASLRSYEIYRPIHNILTTISYEKPFIEIFLEQNRIIVSTKGERRR